MNEKIIKGMMKFHAVWMWIVPVFLTFNVFHVGHQAWYAMYIQHQHDTPLVTAYIAAIAANACCLVYFGMYWMSNKQSVQSRDSTNAFMKQMQEAVMQRYQGDQEITQLKEKVVAYERKLGIGKTEDVEIETPLTSLEEVLKSQLTKD